MFSFNNLFKYLNAKKTTDRSSDGGYEDRNENIIKNIITMMNDIVSFIFILFKIKNIINENIDT